MHKPEIICFAGPNGSGKSVITSIILPYTHGKYINADDIKRTTYCDDLEAAQKAEILRETALSNREDFVFETVLSTDRNLKLLQKAKDEGYFIRCIYVITISPQINIMRVKYRVMAGGHDVPTDKIVSRYYKSLDMIKKVFPLCDRLNIYDNSGESPIRILKKRNDQITFFENPYWNQEQLARLYLLE